MVSAGRGDGVRRGGGVVRDVRPVGPHAVSLPQREAARAGRVRRARHLALPHLVPAHADVSPELCGPDTSIPLLGHQPP